MTPGAFLLAFALLQGSTAQQALVPDIQYPFDERLPLTRVSSVALGQSGQLYVGDPVEGRIGVYGPNGRLVRVLGRSGSGPGEFQGLQRHGVLGDTVWAIDQALRRVVLFDTAGRHLGTLAARREAPPWPAFPEGVIPRAVLRRGLLATYGVESDPAGQRLVLLDATGQRVAQIAHIDFARQRLILRTDGAISVTPFQPLSDSPLWAQSPDGSGVAVVERAAASDRRAGRFTVVVTTPQGRRARAVTCSYTPRAVPQQVSSGLVREAVQRHVRMFGSARDAEAEVRRNLYLPAFYPPVQDIAFDASGRIWLQLDGAEAAPEKVWLVLEPNGTTFTVSAPPRLRVWTARGNLVYGIVQDEFDALHVARFRMTPAPPARQAAQPSRITCEPAPAGS